MPSSPSLDPFPQSQRPFRRTPNESRSVRFFVCVRCAALALLDVGEERMFPPGLLSCLGLWRTWVGWGAPEGVLGEGVEHEDAEGSNGKDLRST